MSLDEFVERGSPSVADGEPHHVKSTGGVYVGLTPREEKAKAQGRTDPREHASGLYTGALAGLGLRVLPATRIAVWRPRWFSR